MGRKLGRFLRRRWLEIALAVCVANLGWFAYAWATALGPGEVRSQRNWDYPKTYISRIHLDLTSPNSYVTLTWAGPKADRQDAGPFHSSVGEGWGMNDCNDPVESNALDSRCTPKGLRHVEGFADQMGGPQYRYVTWIDFRRAVAFHSHPSVPDYPASQGCVRLEPYAARLIHDNSIEGVTEILIDGTWANPQTSKNGAGERNGKSESRVATKSTKIHEEGMNADSR